MKCELTLPLAHTFIWTEGDGGNCPGCEEPRWLRQYQMMMAIGENPFEDLEGCAVCQSCGEVLEQMREQT